MATANPKISLSSSRDIPFNRLVLSQSNVRRVKAGLSIEELACDIERRGLLQSLNVRPVLDGEGAETSTYEVPELPRVYRRAICSVLRLRYQVCSDLHGRRVRLRRVACSRLVPIGVDYYTSPPI
ncbi:hypothetical protein GLUCOINTEAF2_0203146 [Komagataeibacter intermedius AF2]|uniref:Uncharacterized protein n=1 Tax=Komagataeibacter intermedius AF2 TaxID=1458464 RepID=A0A0N1FML7_9PROT|nr:hypothetical protein GLUCOINTEAF2_0203146 [Komagataeibacter intermedius AF2]